MVLSFNKELMIFNKGLILCYEKTIYNKSYKRKWRYKNGRKN